MRGDYMSYVWRTWGKRDIKRHDKHEAMYFHKAGSLSVSCKSCKIWEFWQGHSLYLANHAKFVYGKKSCYCVRHLWFFNINVQN